MIIARNPVHSVLWLILAFFNAAGLMVLVGAEFIAMLLVIVYVGAVAVLFLFVVMMLDIDFAELRAGFVKNFPLGIARRAGAGGASWSLGLMAPTAPAALKLGTPDSSMPRRRSDESNIESIGALLYSASTCSCSRRAGIILLVAMIGAIVLTHRERKDARPQNDLEAGPPPPGGGDRQHASPEWARG